IELNQVNINNNAKDLSNHDGPCADDSSAGRENRLNTVCKIEETWYFDLSRIARPLYPSSQTL
ncbi:MAG: hypothetical protein II766_02015, partial [Paludibacteraceae bacterium]|nr:hypothetical protein [Paludibacteraceae bacterium]